MGLHPRDDLSQSYWLVKRFAAEDGDSIAILFFFEDL